MKNNLIVVLVVILTVFSSLTVFASDAVLSMTIAANPFVVQTGGSSTVYWSSVNTTHCVASGGSNDWTRSRSTSGVFQTGELYTNTTFGMICYSNAGNSTSGSVTVRVSNYSPLVTIVKELSTASQFLSIGNAGATNFTKAVYNFKSPKTTRMVVQELKFVVDNPDSLFALTISGGKFAPVLKGVASFAELALEIPGGSGLNLDVYSSYPGVGLNGVPSGTLSHVSLEYVRYSTYGGVTRTTCTRNFGRCDSVMDAVNSPVMKMMGTVPNLALNSSGAVLSSGMIEVAHLNVSQNARGSVAINQLPVNMDFSSGVTADASSLLLKDNAGVVVPAHIEILQTSPEGFRVVVHFQNGYVIPAGLVQTFHIFVRFNSVVGVAPRAILDINTPYLFGWTDLAGGAVFPTIWDNGVFFYNYPSNYVTLH